MATAYKDAQVVGTASTGTYSTLYSTDGSKTAVISTIAICNEAASAVTVRVGLDTTAGTPASGEFILYDRVIPANDTLFLSVGLALGNTKYIRVSSSATTVTFTAAIAEIT